MLTLNDGRSELWQWDTGRTLSVDADCSQVHFSNKVFGRSIDVDVVDGVAGIPDILLQSDKDLNVWAFVGTADNGYTKISKTFKVNRRNKPADYVFTPVEQTTIAEIAAIAQSVRDDADAGRFDGAQGPEGPIGPVGAPGKDGTNGADGITPSIGDNGNWYLGTTDTGKPSRGETGAQGTPGKDGHSPVVTATKSGKTTTISVDGMAIATVEDGADGGGVSADAVLYNPQTLTEAQKKQARQNIGVDVNYFVVNGTPNADRTITIDKTFAQIREAIGDGKIPVAAIAGYYFQLSQNTDRFIMFSLTVYDKRGFAIVETLYVYPDDHIQVYSHILLTTNPDGTLPQVEMADDPAEPMQIATKKYVDDKECILKSTTPGSTKEFKITVDDSGNISATEVT